VGERGSHLQENYGLQIGYIMRSEHALLLDKRVGYVAVNTFAELHTEIASHRARNIIA
jgi:hypothetical protein